jgi:glycosyltransferase involved in cell wall biosynthesis
VRIIYAYEGDAADVNTQSGRPLSILHQLERCAEIVRVFPLRQHLRYLYAAKYLYHRQHGRTYRPDREPRLLRSLARQIERRVRGIDADCLFAPGSHVMAELDVPYPKIFCADATFANVLETYDSFSNCTPEFINQGDELDRKALANCDAAIYPSEWAARSAIEKYGAHPEKIHVIPFGANVAATDQATVRAQIEARRFDELRLLFVGRDWHRKGGDVVLATCELLHKRKVPLRLDLVGLPQVPVALPRYARSHGLLDQKNSAKRALLEQLFAQSHFLFVPSQAENYGMVFCEAAAFGLPSVTTTVGGIPTIVRHGKTGFTLPAKSRPEVFADLMQRMMNDPGRYHDMCTATRQDYQGRLNWRSFRDQLMKVLHDLRNPKEEFERKS